MTFEVIEEISTDDRECLTSTVAVWDRAREKMKIFYYFYENQKAKEMERDMRTSHLSNSIKEWKKTCFRLKRIWHKHGENEMSAPLFSLCTALKKGLKGSIAKEEIESKSERM